MKPPRYMDPRRGMRWLRHVRHWLRSFPKPGHDYHLWISTEGRGHFKCWCGQPAPHDDAIPLTWQEDIMNRVMVVCGTCGNKRCPGVNGHPCTGSNAPGQPGSNFA